MLNTEVHAATHPLAIPDDSIYMDSDDLKQRFCAMLAQRRGLLLLPFVLFFCVLFSVHDPLQVTRHVLCIAVQYMGRKQWIHTNSMAIKSSWPGPGRSQVTQCLIEKAFFEQTNIKRVQEDKKFVLLFLIKNRINP